MSRKIYLASSWRNTYQPQLLQVLRSNGHEVYDFRQPVEGDPESGFAWQKIDPLWREWDIPTYIRALSTKEAFQGFNRDWNAMKWADTFVLLLPCGRSAHLEAGWAIGQKKDTYIYLKPEQFEPDLMYKMATIVTSDDALLSRLRRPIT